MRRLGVTPQQPGIAQLRELHEAHLKRIPFENLSIHLREGLDLEPAALEEKVLGRGRGGFCYELNGLFAILLECLGYGVARLGAEVWAGEGFGPPLDHLVLRVTTEDGQAWAVDVGFGDHSLYPLRWAPGVDQPDPDGVFRLEPAGAGDWDVYRNGVVQYRVEAHERELRDFDAMCWYQQTSPRSHFTRSLVCTRRTDEGRVTLSGRRLIITSAGGRSESSLESDSEVLEGYRRLFGIELERVPEVAAEDDLERRDP
jgi:N-hydroxyarylamine O-acetyltransferase